MASKFQIPIAFKSDPRGLKEAEGALAGFGKKLAGIGAAVAGAFAVRAVFNFGKEAILAAEQVKQANDTLIAVAKATNVFGVRTDEVTQSLIKFAEAQEMRIGVDAEVVKGVQAQLLSFKKLSVSAGQTGGIFDRTTKAAFDMAQVLGTDAGSAAIQLGKALEDPIRGLTALRRGGTVFTESQKEMIETMVESGNLMGAQTLILNELESQYGGAAEAGALWSERLRLAFDNIKESVGKALTPAFERFAKFLIEDVIPPITNFFDKDFPLIIEKTGAFIETLAPIFSSVGDGIRQAFDISETQSLLDAFIAGVESLGTDQEFLGFLRETVEGFAMMLPDLIQLVPLMLELAQTVVPQLVGVLPPLIDFLGILVDIFVPLIKFLAEAVYWFTSLDDKLPGWAKGLEIIFDPIRVLSDAFQTLGREISAAWNALKRFFDLQDSRSAGRAFPVGPGGSGRAVGGPVSANRTYMVGERGPELFTPGAGGFITPNNRLGGGGSGPVYNITVNAGMGASGAQLGEQIVSAIKRYERVSGPVFASA